MTTAMVTTSTRWATLLMATAAAGAAASPPAERAALVAELVTLPPVLPAGEAAERLGFHGLCADPAWVTIDFETTVEPQKIVLFPARGGDTAAKRGSGFPAAIAVEIATEPSFAEPVRLAAWQEEQPGAGEQLPWLVLPGNGAAGRFLRVTISGFRRADGDPGEEFYRLGEIVVLADGRNAARGCSVTATRSIDSSRRWEPRNLTDGYCWCLPLRGAGGSATDGHQSEVHDQPVVSGDVWAEIDLGEPVAIDEVHLVPADPPGFADSPGYGFPTHFTLLADHGTADERALLTELVPPFPAAALPNPGGAQVMVATPGLVARTIRVSCEALWRRGPGSGMPASEYVFALAEVQCWHRGVNRAAGRPVRVSDAIRAGRWRPEALVDGSASRQPLLDWDRWISGLERRLVVEAAITAIDERLAADRDRQWQRRFTLAIAALGVVTAAAGGGLVWQRIRARREREALQRRLARDLHDELGASLSHLAIQSDLARRDLARRDQTGQPAAARRLEELSATARETLDAMRDAVWLLAARGGSWRELGQRLESISRRHLDGVPHAITVRGTPPAGEVAGDWARAAVAFLKEGLTNVRRHAQAGHVRVTLDWSDALSLEIEDDGRGFAIDGNPPPAGLGLESLRTRAASLHGDCELASRPGGGTTLRLVAPLPMHRQSVAKERSHERG
jgi:signal transduction histidine kinase